MRSAFLPLGSVSSISLMPFSKFHRVIQVVGRPPLTLAQDEAFPCLSKRLLRSCFRVVGIGHTNVRKHFLCVLGTPKPLNRQLKTTVLRSSPSSRIRHLLSTSVGVYSSALRWFPSVQRPFAKLFDAGLRLTLRQIHQRLVRRVM